MSIIKNNKKLKIILTMFCIIFYINISTSYASIIKNFNFKNITIEDGLSQSTIKKYIKIVKDIYGFQLQMV